MSQQDEKRLPAQEQNDRLSVRQTAMKFWPLLVAIACYNLLYNSPSSRKVVVDLPGSYALCSKSHGIYTVDDARPRAECILVQGDRILDVGSKAEVRASWNILQQKTGSGSLSGESLQIYPIKKGSIVVPGLADPHAHILEYGFKMQLQLDGANSIAEIVTRIESYILAHPDVHNDRSKWIEGMGWDQNRWGGGFPTARDLSSPLLDGRPIALSRVDVHAAWVSPRVLDIMGELPDKVDGGEIIRDTDGKATGIFVDNAMSLIPSPPRSTEQMLEYFERTMGDAVAVGLTSIGDAGNERSVVEFYKKLADDGKIPIRLYIMGMVSSDAENVDGGIGIPRLENYGTHGRLNVRSIKLFFDGALGSWGAALLAPYTDKPDTSGILRVDPEKMRDDVRWVWREGWQVNIHCIGDRANKLALDIFEELLEDGNGKDNATERRPRIEHAQIMREEDLERIGRLGIIASVQPTHATSDMWYAESRLGQDRIKGAYAYQTLLQNSPSNVLPLSSDFPVEGINPLVGFYAAVSRLNAVGESPHGQAGWFPKQRLSRAQALKGMTLDAAYASFAEQDIGSLIPGKKADFVVLDRDIMLVPLRKILGTKVMATVVDGRVVYGGL